MSSAAQLRSVARLSQYSSIDSTAAEIREPSGGSSPRRYLPERNPPPSGLQGITPSPSSTQTGKTSRSMLRSTSEYCGCRQTYLAAPDQIGEGGEGLLQRRRGIPTMHLIEIYIIRAKAPEAILATLHYVFAREADVVRAFPHREADLRGQDHVVTDAPERPAGDLLGDAVRVDVSGVHEVAPGIEKPAEDLSGSLLVGLLPEGHAPQAQLGDHQPRVPKTCVLHTPLLSDLC